MQHKYVSTALVLGRSSHGEANSLLVFLTPDLGLIRVRAQGIRKPGAKLAAAVQTFSETDVTLIRAKDGWRLAGAILAEDHFDTLSTTARTRAGRVAELLIRLVHGESADPRFFSIFRAFLYILPTLDDEQSDAAECLAVLRLLHVLGLDAGPLPDSEEAYDEGALQEITDNRAEYIKRINSGIESSGL